jgi:hypothetical protein
MPRVPVMESLTATPHEAEADLFVTTNAMAGEPIGEWTQQQLSALQSSLDAIVQICATPETPWAQQFVLKGFQ